MTFLGIPIKIEVGKLFSDLKVPGNKEDLSNLHITIIIFEDNWKISELSKAMEIAYDVITDIKNFSIKINKISCFPKRKDNPCPIIAEIESKELHDLREKLCKEFDKNDIEYSKTFKEYKPHLTLSYTDKEIDSFKIDEIEISVYELVLMSGDKGESDVFITFPLKCLEKKKNSSLLNRINEFYKISHNIYFRKSRSIPMNHIFQKMLEEKIPNIPIFLPQAIKLVEQGLPVSEKDAISLIKELENQKRKGFYEGFKDHSYNKSIGQGNQHALNREDWHILGKLISNLNYDLYPEN